MKKLKKAEWDEWINKADDDDKIMAGGYNPHLEDDFM